MKIMSKKFKKMFKKKNIVKAVVIISTIAMLATSLLPFLIYRF